MKFGIWYFDILIFDLIFLFLILWYFDIWFDNEHDFHICWFGKINLALSYIILYYDIFHNWFLEFGESYLDLSHIILYYM